MKEKLINFCKEINIDCIGITDKGPYLDFQKRWESQIEKGYITGFEEMDIQKRIDPCLTFEDTKSVIVCLFPYFSKEELRGNLSKYAHGLDYHMVAMEKLNAIGEFLGEHIEGFEYKVFADSGPLSDRYLAHRAGLGVWGMNSLLITEKYGSYVFIGYILNNHPFKIDAPLEQTCSKCFKCVKSCPGECINGDFTINPTKCKSFLTQKKEELTDSEKEIMKKTPLIWGCDVCQDVCPHNEIVNETSIEEFKRDLKPDLTYEEVSEISNKEFGRRYRERAYGWRGRKVLERNHKIVNNKE